jgi:type I restriction enzyme S subunit
MGKWKTRTIRDLCFIGRGRVISQQELESNGDYPVYSSQTIDNGEMGRISTFNFDGEYVTWTTDGANAGTVFYRNGKFNCTNVCGTLLSKGEINTRFLSYRLSTIAKKHVSYIGNPKLMNNILANIPIFFPVDIREQLKIAEILSNIDTVIEKTKAVVEKYKRIKTGMMQDLLTNGIDEKGNIRSPKTHKYKDSPIGKIPVEWEYGYLSDICFINRGSLPVKYDYLINYIDIESVSTGRIHSYTTYNCEDAPSRAKRKVKEHDVLMSTVRPNLKAFVVALNIPDNTICSTGFAVLRANPGIDYRFIYYSILEYSTEKQIAQLVSGSSYPAINSTDVASLLIPICKIEEQEQIANKLSSIDTKINSEQVYLEKLRRIKQSLMQDLLTHKVAVDTLL